MKNLILIIAILLIYTDSFSQRIVTDNWLKKWEIEKSMSYEFRGYEFIDAVDVDIIATTVHEFVFRKSSTSSTYDVNAKYISSNMKYYSSFEIELIILRFMKDNEDLYKTNSVVVMPESNISYSWFFVNHTFKTDIY